MVGYSILGLIVAWIIWKQVKKAKIRRAAAHIESIKQSYRDKDYSKVISSLDKIEIPDWYLCCAYAHSLFETNEVAKGRDFFKKAFSMGGNKDETRMNYGFCEYNHKNYNEAIKLLQEIDPDYLKDEVKYSDSYTVYEALGKSFLELKKPLLAIEALKRAPGKKDMTIGLVSLNKVLAEAYELAGDKKNALKVYQKIAAHSYDQEISEKIDKLSNE